MHAGERLCTHERRQKCDVRMQSDTSLPPVMALDLLASGRRKLFTEGPPLLAPAIIMLSDKV